MQGVKATFSSPASVQLPLSCRVSSCANVLNWTRVSLPPSLLLLQMMVNRTTEVHTRSCHCPQSHSDSPTSFISHLLFSFRHSFFSPPWVCSTARCTLPVSYNPRNRPPILFVFPCSVSLFFIYFFISLFQDKRCTANTNGKAAAMSCAWALHTVCTCLHFGFLNFKSFFSFCCRLKALCFLLVMVGLLKCCLWAASWRVSRRVDQWFILSHCTSRLQCSVLVKIYANCAIFYFFQCLMIIC